MKKKLVLFSVLMLATASPVVASPIGVYIESHKVQLTDAAPYVEDGRTMVPVRVVSENLGADVKWDANTKAFGVTGTNVKSKKTVSVVGKANNPTVTVNGESKRLDPSSNKVVVTIKQGRTFVPLRFFSETLGYDVSYNGASKTVYINSDKKVDTNTNKEVVYKPGMKPNDFINKVPDRVEDMDMSDGGNQSHLGPNGCFVIVGPTSPYDSADKGFTMKMVINGWNNPNYQDPPQIVVRNAKTMKAVEEILSMYTVDYKKVYNELDWAITDKGNHDGHTVKTKDGRTFKFTGESSGIIVRIK